MVAGWAKDAALELYRHCTGGKGEPQLQLQGPTPETTEEPASAEGQG